KRQQEEQKRIAALEAQKRQDEQKRIAALEEQKRQQEEQKRIAALEEQKRQDEQKRVAALEEQKRQDEQKRIAALPITQPPPTKANLPEQIRQAQTELKRLGCFDGELDGKMSTTDKAIKAFWHLSRKPVAEINITDDFINDLQRQPDDFCVPPSKKPPAIAR